MTAEGSSQPQKPIYKKWWFWVGIIVILAAIGRSGEKSTQPPVSSQSAQPPSQPQPTAQPSQPPSQSQPTAQPLQSQSRSQAKPDHPKEVVGSPSLPKKEQAFIQAVESVKAEYDSAPNELKKSAIRTKRGKLIQDALGGSRTISDWVGVICQMETTGEGKAILGVKMEGVDITIGTQNNELSDISDNTLIPQGNSLYSIISEMSKGDRVVFSGSFLESDGNDFVRESSVTEQGSMSDPEFVIRFKSIRKY